jgi:hypothetical protein
MKTPWMRKKKPKTTDDLVREAHDDLVLLMDYLRGEDVLYKDQPPMSREEITNALDRHVLVRLKQALGVVQGGNIETPNCTQ